MKPAHEIIKESRIKNGMSQKALADKLGMSQQAIALLEHGKRKIDFDTFIKIMEILKEPLIDIFVNIGISETEIEDKLGTLVCTQVDESFRSILKSAGAIIDDNYHDKIELKYNNKMAFLTYDEYENLRVNIMNYIHF